MKSKICKRLPLVLASVHAAIVVALFLPAIFSPGKLGLLPIPMYYVDYPASILLIRANGIFGAGLNVEKRLAIDFCAFLIGGSIWLYCVVKLLLAAAVRLMEKSSALRN